MKIGIASIIPVELKTEPLQLVDYVETVDGKIIPIERMSIYDLRKFMNEFKEKMVVHLRARKKAMKIPVAGPKKFKKRY